MTELLKFILGLAVGVFVSVLAIAFLVTLDNRVVHDEVKVECLK